MLKFYKISLLYFIIVSIICIFAAYEFSYMLALFICTTIIFSLIIAWGASHIGSQMFVKTECSNYKAIGKIAITFDDGPDENNMPEILKLLLEYDSKATFFLIGNKIEKNPRITTDILTAGHLIANHSYSHSNCFPLLNSTKIVQEITKTQDIIKKTTGQESLFFRPPFGVTNPLIYKALNKFNLKTIGWNIRSLDTKNESPEIVVNRITRNLKSGDIILLHDTSQHILVILKELLEYLKKQNIKAVTIQELL